MSARQSTKYLDKRKSITIVQYNWPLQSFTILLAEKLSPRYEVALCIDSASLDLSVVDVERLRCKGIRVLECPSFSLNLLPTKISGLSRKSLNYLNNKFVVLKKIRLSYFRKFVEAHVPITNIIAVEKEALLAASEIAKAKTITYYSLELYGDSHLSTNVYRYLRKAEKAAIKTIDNLIIQDEFRERALRKSIGVLEPKYSALYLPVSAGIREGGTAQVENYLRSTFKLPHGEKIILYFGLIKLKNRGLEGLIESIQPNTGYTVVIHGHGSSRDVKALKLMAKNKPVVFSTNLVPEEKILDIINSAEYGFCWYASSDANNRHTAFSSEKIALFLKFAIPLITNYSETYEKLYSKFNCGIPIEDPRRTLAAVNSAAFTVEEMRRDANLAFAHFYSAERNLNYLIQRLDDSMF